MTIHRKNTAVKTVEAVQLKRRLQRLAEKKLEGMSSEELIEFLQKKYGRDLAPESSTSARR